MSQVLDLAKQGDADAIAALMNRSLTPQGVKARVILQGTTLQILLESLEVPAQERLCNYIVQGLRKIGTPTIKRLELFGKQSDCEGYAWTQNYQVEKDNFTPMSAIEAKVTPVTPVTPVTSSQDVSSLDNAAMIKLAKTGQIDAIEAFVKLSLADREDVIPFIELDGSVLKVIIETKQFLDGQAFCAKFGGKMNVLTGGIVKELAVYKRRNAKSLPFLMNQMTLFSNTSRVDDVMANPRPNGQSSAMDNANNAVRSINLETRSKPQLDTTRVVAAIAVLGGLVLFLVIQIPRIMSRFGFFGYFALVMAMLPAFKFYRFFQPLMTYILTGK